MPPPPKRPGPPAPDPNWEVELHAPLGGADRGAPASGRDELLAHAVHRGLPRGRPLPVDEFSDEERSTQPPLEEMSEHVARLMAEAEMLEWGDSGMEDEGDRPTRDIFEPSLEVREPVAPPPRALPVKAAAAVAVAAKPARSLSQRMAAVDAVLELSDLSDMPAVFSFEDDVGAGEPVSNAAITPSFARPPSSAPAISPPFGALDLSAAPVDELGPVGELGPVDELGPKVAAIATRFAAGDYGRALVLAEAALEEHPQDASVAEYAEGCREALYHRYLERLGAASCVPRLAMHGSALTGLALDHRTGFLLSCVDGFSTIEEIIDVAAMPRLEAVRILYELVQEGAIEMLSSRG